VVERADRAPVSTFYAPGAWASLVELDEAAAHHAQVKRLRERDNVRLTSGDGRRASGRLVSIAKRRVVVELDVATVVHVPAPPTITLLAPVGDRERMLLLAEKGVELGLSTWRPVVCRRSLSVTPRGEGEQFRQKVRLRMISALEQSGGAWLPELLAETSVSEAIAAAADATRLLLDANAPSLVGQLAALSGPCAVALGPEGGLEPEERDAFVASGWRPVSIGDNVLRFETAGIAALALLRVHLNRGPHDGQLPVLPDRAPRDPGGDRVGG
jgi:16S rRNA (uracil1498-N3)-methyltransferase